MGCWPYWVEGIGVGSGCEEVGDGEEEALYQGLVLGL
jgi:hypothetical protein